MLEDPLLRQAVEQISTSGSDTTVTDASDSSSDEESEAPRVRPPRPRAQRLPTESTGRTSDQELEERFDSSEPEDQPPSYQPEYADRTCRDFRSPLSIFQDPVELAKAQEKDINLRELINYLKHQEFPEQMSEARKRTLMMNAQKYVLCNGVLYEMPLTHHLREKTMSSTVFSPDFKVVIPTGLQTMIIFYHHASAASGHRGITSTVNLIRSRYTWNNMGATVTRYIKECPECQRLKALHKNKVDETCSTRLSLAVGDLISADLIENLKPANTGERYIIVFQDQLTRYVWLKALKTKSAVSCGQAMLYTVCSHVGLPRALQTDRGTAFTSLVIRALTERMGVRQIFISVANSQSNAINERSHGHINNCIRRHALKHNINTWPEIVSMAQLSHNLHINSTTGYSPLILMYGRIPYLGLQTYDTNHVYEGSLDDSLNQRLEFLRDTRERALQNWKAEQQARSQGQAGETTTYKPFTLVLLKVKSNIRTKHGKWAAAYQNKPLMVLERQGGSYLLACPHTGQPLPLWVSHRQLTRYQYPSSAEQGLRSIPFDDRDTATSADEDRYMLADDSYLQDVVSENNV
jgi:transposase InsO family protein